MTNATGEIFCWHKSRIDCLAKIVLALFQVRTVNLSEIALAMYGKAQVSSNYRRLQRFFALCPSTMPAWHAGALVLSVAHEGSAIPLFWQMLPKDDTSTVSSATNNVSAMSL
jgi:hypothetical protein